MTQKAEFYKGGHSIVHIGNGRYGHVQRQGRSDSAGDAIQALHELNARSARKDCRKSWLEYLNDQPKREAAKRRAKQERKR